MPGLVPAQPLRHANGRGRGAAGAERETTGLGTLGSMLPQALACSADDAARPCCRLRASAARSAAPQAGLNRRDLARH
jgi:hypothetical protein